MDLDQKKNKARKVVIIAIVVLVGLWWLLSSRGPTDRTMEAKADGAAIAAYTAVRPQVQPTPDVDETTDSVAEWLVRDGWEKEDCTRYDCTMYSKSGVGVCFVKKDEWKFYSEKKHGPYSEAKRVGPRQVESFATVAELEVLLKESEVGPFEPTPADPQPEPEQEPENEPESVLVESNNGPRLLEKAKQLKAELQLDTDTIIAIYLHNKSGVNFYWANMPPETTLELATYAWLSVQNPFQREVALQEAQEDDEEPVHEQPPSAKSPFAPVPQDDDWMKWRLADGMISYGPTEDSPAWDSFQRKVINKVRDEVNNRRIQPEPEPAIPMRRDRGRGRFQSSAVDWDCPTGQV